MIQIPPDVDLLEESKPRASGDDPKAINALTASHE